MATNKLAAFGLRPYRHKSTIGKVTEEYQIASGYATNIGLYDVVKLGSGGTIELADPGDTPLGIYMGGYNKFAGAGSQGSLTNLNPYFKDWVAGTVVPTGQTARALVVDDPGETLVAQVIGSVSDPSDTGGLVDVVAQPIRSIYGTSGAGVTGTTQGREIDPGSLTVTNGGTGYSSDTYVTFDGGGYGEDVTITIASGVITAITVNFGGAGWTDATPAVTVTDPAGTGSGAVIADYTASALSAPSQFKIERFIEWPIEVLGTNNAHQGYSLSTDGALSFVELRYAKHARAI